jgi:ribosome-dependent ATPase
MNAGRVLAVGTPWALAEARHAPTLEEAFILYLEAAEPSQVVAAPDAAAFASAAARSTRSKSRFFNTGRCWAYARRETVELLRDKVRLSFALAGPMVMMITFGFGISFDVEHLPYAAFDQDRSLESRQLLESFEGSRYFARHDAIADAAEMDARLKSGELALAIEIPHGFGQRLVRGLTPDVAIWLDGAMPFRAETMRGYVTGLSLQYLSDQAIRSTGQSLSAAPITIQTRFRYNQDFSSVFAIVPGVIMLMLVLIPAMMTAVAVVREKETGSIANFRASPVTRLEFLLGKQAPYVVIAGLSFLTLAALSLLLFGVGVKGSLVALLAGVALYVLATTGFGLLVSSFLNTQVAAIFATAIITIIPAVNFSGLLTPVSALSGSGRALGLAFPASWFQQISVGTFTKGLGLAELWTNHLALAGFGVAFIAAAAIALRKQEA